VVDRIYSSRLSFLNWLINYRLKSFVTFRPLLRTGRHVALGRSGALPPNFLCPPNFVVPIQICFKHTIKTKILKPWKCILPLQTLKPVYGPVNRVAFLMNNHTVCLYFDLRKDDKRNVIVCWHFVLDLTCTKRNNLLCYVEQ